MHQIHILFCCLLLLAFLSCEQKNNSTNEKGKSIALLKRGMSDSLPQDPYQGSDKNKETAYNDTGIVDPFKGMSFKPGDIIKQKLDIPVGNIKVDGTLEYEIMEDPDGVFFQNSGKYKVHISKVKITGVHKDQVPEDLVKILNRDTYFLDLTAAQIENRIFSYKEVGWFVLTGDFNMDGVEDLAISYCDFAGQHCSDPNYDIWVNLRGKLVFWKGLSGVHSEQVDFQGRTLEIQTLEKKHIKFKKFKVKQDTFLIPLDFK